ncbi:hypothetical protein PhaeoP75_01133 [Phaeobacter gallaeciensis]|uniref:hypothetical protein n=1 Tax=Phaeobacter gallaeciensis TaxID=60890 RepID=UPI000BBC4FAE|nr:hypothetical protein [Phaeobacter gallaeciensis]ATF00792.1 hypothetical protein PhaeoP75_01133 [Phaeobacter gallaeciensis]
MQTTKLQADAIIGGKRYPAGVGVTAKPEAIALGIKRAAKADIRAQIEARAGDALSILGTQADVLGIVLMHTLADVIATTENPGNEGQRRRLEIMQALAGEADLGALAQAALAKVTSGEAILTASLKGLEGVIDETLARSTETAQVLIQASGAQSTGNEETTNA